MSRSRYESNSEFSFRNVCPTDLYQWLPFMGQAGKNTSKFLNCAGAVKLTRKVKVATRVFGKNKTEGQLIMNLGRILLKTRPQNGVLRKSTLSRLLNSHNNSTVPRRLLISSAETGGIGVAKKPMRITTSMKMTAAGLFLASLVVTQQMFVKEEQINKALGTQWNTGLVATVIEYMVAPPLLAIMILATIPL